MQNLNLALTVHALKRVLFHLDESKYLDTPTGMEMAQYLGMAAARCEVKRRLRFAEQSLAEVWQTAKDSSTESKA